MRKLHDLKIMLSTDAQLSRRDCMKIKGGSFDGEKRRNRTTDSTEPAALVCNDTVTTEVGGLFGGG